MGPGRDQTRYPGFAVRLVSDCATRLGNIIYKFMLATQYRDTGLQKQHLDIDHYMSHGMRFPTMWHVDKCRLRRACAVSCLA